MKRHLLVATEAFTFSRSNLCVLLMSLVCGMLSSCQQGNDPRSWARQIASESRRAQALVQLQDRVDRIAERRSGDSRSQELQLLAAQIAEPLSGAYVTAFDSMDLETRSRVMRTLVSLGDRRIEPAVTKALREFAREQRGADIRWAAQAIADLDLKGSAPQLLDAFVHVHASTALGGLVQYELRRAMLETANPAWKPVLRNMLEKHSADPSPGSPNQKPAGNSTNSPATEQAGSLSDDERFWQSTAMDVLGELRDADSVPWLLKVVLSGQKSQLHNDALRALARIGEPAIDAASNLILENDKQLISFGEEHKKPTLAGERTEPKPHIRAAARVLGAVGRSSAMPPLLKTIDKEDDQVRRGQVGLELVNVPATNDSKAAFRKALESILIEDSPAILATFRVHLALAEAVTEFYDPELVYPLFEYAERATRPKYGPMTLTMNNGLNYGWFVVMAQTDSGDVRQWKKFLGKMLAASIVLLADKEKWAIAEKAVKKFEDSELKEKLAMAKTLLDKCQRQVSCYFDELFTPNVEIEPTSYVGIKAAQMLGTYGDAGVASQLSERYASLVHPDVRLAAARAIQMLSPRGSAEISHTIRALLEAETTTADLRTIERQPELESIMARLEARAR